MNFSMKPDVIRPEISHDLVRKTLTTADFFETAEMVAN